jgi:hypothetical protein
MAHCPRKMRSAKVIVGLGRPDRNCIKAPMQGDHIDQGQGANDCDRSGNAQARFLKTGFEPRVRSGSLLSCSIGNQPMQ